MFRLRLRLYLACLCMAASQWLPAQEDSVQSLLPSSTYNVLYLAQPQKRSVASVSEIYTPELLKTQSTTLGGWLSGRLAGVQTLQSGGEPGFDDVAVFIRGREPMIMIDGTPQSFPSINPEQVESITILKDALSTAMLGMRGANGAILITTKKGLRQKQTIELNAMHGVQRPTAMPEYLKAHDFATLYNEALANDGLGPVYSQADLDAYRMGNDPIGHPGVDWQKEILKDQAPYSRYDMNISGGNKTTRYFVNLDYLNQQGLLKEEGFNTYSTNSEYKRYMLRSNVEVDLTNSITASLNLLGRIQNSNQPGVTTAGIFNTLRNTPNNAYPKLNTDGSLGGNTQYQNNLYGQSVLSGYMPVYERDFKADLIMKAKLDKLVKGLWIKALSAINAYQRETINRSKTFAVFMENADKTYTKFGIAGDQQNVNNVNSQNRLFYTELSMGYSKAIDANNNIQALVLASNDYRRINTELPFSFTGVSGKVSYDYKQRYFVEVAAGYNGTERFPKSKRYGFFPAAGIGWEVTQEDFLKDNSWLNYLKLRSSFGKTGNANVGYYDYYQYYVTGTGYGFGNTVPSTTTTLMQGTLANPAITWEKVNKFSAGVDAQLFNRQLSLTADYFNEKNYDLVQARTNGSDILGTDYVRENIGVNRYTGFELQASWKQDLGIVTYHVTPNLTWLRSEVELTAEPQYMYEYLARTGRPVGQAFGYVAEGLFNSQQEIDAHAFQGGTIKPGDIKYKDLNGDQVVNSFDQQAIGETKPRLYYGLNTGVAIKGIELNILLQGVAHTNVNVAAFRAFQNNGRGQAYEDQLNRWTPQNATNASYPRLWIGNNVNNQLTSSYWLRKGDYLRVKNIELAYSLPVAVVQKAKLSGVRVFVNGTNLFTFSSLMHNNIDPESWSTGYPIMKMIMAGINIKL